MVEHKKYKLSVIVPVFTDDNIIYNFELKVLKKNIEDIEVVIIDDGNSLEISNLLKSFGNLYTNTKVISFTSNQGAGYARNIGIQNARGEYIYFFDIDDEFIGFEKLIQLYHRMTEVKTEILGGTVSIINEGHKTDKVFPHLDFWKFAEYQDDYGFTRYLYKTQFLRDNQIYFPDYRRYQDPPFLLKALHVAEEFYVVKDVTYIINAHEKYNWNEGERIGLKDGITQNMKFSLEHKYYECYRHNMRRVFADFGRVWHRYDMENCDLIEKIKENNILQEIIFPNSDITGEKDLYFRVCNNGFCTGEECLEIGPGSIVDFNSYFNAFPSSKWKKYTDVSSVSLILDIQGEVEVTLYHNKIMYGTVHSKAIKIHNVSAPDRQFVHFDFQELSELGNFSFTLTAKHEKVILYDGFYLDNYPANKREVKAAVVFTTYRRENYVKKNLERMSLLEKDKVQVYVVDNASTLDVVSNDMVTVITNGNIGGAGGFSRGMMQIIDDGPSFGYTHCILMDDDVILDPRILTRLCNFLGRVRSEYSDAFVGGAMLRKDQPYMQVESGALWNKGKVESYGRLYDMRDPYMCLKNELYCEPEYNAWWFCVVPIKYIRNNNLPLPIFVFHDDVDFGLRNKTHIITLNGVCIWHDAFESKLSAMRLYYENRNKLIVNSVHRMNISAKETVRSIEDRVMTELYMYRYANANAILSGVEDFLKGPEWLCDLNAEKFNESVVLMNRKLEFIPNVNYDWYRLCCTIEDCDWLHKLVRIVTSNGLKLKANRFIILPFYASQPVQAYRASEILYYDEITGKGYFCKKDMEEIVICRKRLKNVIKQIKKNYDSVVGKFEEAYLYMISREQWERYLERQSN